MHFRPLRRPWLKVIVAGLIAALVSVFILWPIKEDRQLSYIVDKTYKLTIINTNGLVAEKNPARRNDQLIQRQMLIGSIRSEVEADGGKLFLLSGGELGDDDLLNHHNQLGYHAMSASPQFFSEPMNTIRQKQAAADFPFLSANLYESETGIPIFDAYALFDVEGLRIAVMGITQPIGLDAVSGKSQQGIYQHGIELIDPKSSAAEFVPSLRDQADIVIATTRAANQNNTDAGLSAVPGIDLIVGNNLVDNAQQIADASQPNQLACHSTVDRIDVEFRNGKLKRTNSITISLCNNQIKPESC